MFGSGTARRNAEAYRRKGLQGSARELARAILGRGVAGATILEVGGGVGAIELELLRAGAARAMNVELSPEYEEQAADLAREAGVGGRVERVVGDFAASAHDVPEADVVVMHRVVCCYPSLSGLLAPAAAKARRALALTFPRDIWPLRVALALGNVGLALTRCSFRAYVHPVSEIERIVAAHGLRAAHRRSGWIWESVVYERSTA